MTFLYKSASRILKGFDLKSQLGKDMDERCDPASPTGFEKALLVVARSTLGQTCFQDF